MPKIRLKQKYGHYGCGDQSFHAGKVYEVSSKIAYYLVNSQKVAVEVSALEEKIIKEKKVLEPSQFNSPLSPLGLNTLKIALIRLGGIGDTLVLAGQATAIKRKYSDCNITLYIRDLASSEIVQGNKDVDRVVMAGNKMWNSLLSHILQQDFDIVYDSRYMTKIIFKNPEDNEDDIAENEKLLEPYKDEFLVFPFKNNNIYSKENLNTYDLGLKTALLEGSPDDMFVNIDKKDYDMLSLLENDVYVTVHNGSDFARQTKCWVTAYWNDVVKYIKSRGMKVIQLGNSLEEKIEGAIDMRGKSNIKQTSAFINKARLHVDTEGGLVHIARAVRTRSVVLFGPTSFGFFKYDENINIETPSQCKDCWWTTDMWWRDCPKGDTIPPRCMSELSPKLVIENIKKGLNMDAMEKRPDYDIKDVNEQFALELELDENHYKSEAWQNERVEMMMAQMKGKTALEVGAGDGYCVEVLTQRGYDVTATEISKIRLDRMKKRGIDAHYADVNKLPFPDNSFDTVFCGEVLEHIDSVAQGFKELERVCKPDGRIVISLPVEKGHRGIKMHLWGIDMFPIEKDGRTNMVVMNFERINRE